jgi:hypothetical protein
MMVSLDELVEFCERALKDRRWLFFPVLLFFALVSSGYFLRCLVWGYYPLGSDFLTTVALSSFVSFPLLFFSVILYNDISIIGFISEHNRSPTFDEKGEYFFGVVLYALAVCSMVEWMIIAAIFVERYALITFMGGPGMRLLSASALFVLALLALVTLLYQKERERKNLEEILKQQRELKAKSPSDAAQQSFELLSGHL